MGAELWTARTDESAQSLICHPNRIDRIRTCQACVVSCLASAMYARPSSTRSSGTAECLRAPRTPRLAPWQSWYAPPCLNSLYEKTFLLVLQPVPLTMLHYKRYGL